MDVSLTESAPVIIYRLNGEGGGQRVPTDTSNLVASPETPVWVHLDAESSDNTVWLAEQSGLRPVVADALMELETRPRAVAYPDGVMVVLRGVNLNPGADPEDMVSIRIWLEAGRIITTSRRRLLSVDDIREQLEQGNGPRTEGRFLIMLAHRMMDRAGVIINDLEDAIGEVEEHILAQGESRLRGELAELRRVGLVLRRFFGPQREALARLVQEPTPLFDDRDRLRLREVADQVTRYVEDLDAARERAGVAHEELLSRLSEQMNQRMYVLSVVAAIFLPLGFFTGLFGINVGGMPGVDSPMGFWLVTALMAAIGIAVLLVFRWRRWF